MKLELLTSIERDYRMNTETFVASLQNAYIQDNCYRLVIRGLHFYKFVVA